MVKIKICREPGCHNSTTTKGYCRLHYLSNWKRLKEESKERAAKKLNRYIEYVMKKHPDRYMEIIKKDLRTPGFEDYVEDNFGFDEKEPEVQNGQNFDEDLEELIRKLKVEKGF